MQYHIRVTNTTKVVLALIFTPLIIVPEIVFGAIYGPPLPDWAIYTIIFALLGIALALTIYVIKKVSPEGVITMTVDGFRVDFVETNLFTPAPFEVKTNQITNFFAEGKNGLYYLSFTTTGTPHKFNIEARSKNEQDIASFAEFITVITELIEQNNEIHNNDVQTIAHVSMYEKGWAKILAASVLIIAGWVLYAKLFLPEEQTPSWWRLSTVIIFGTPFVYQVYYYNYGKGKKKNSK